ESCKKLAQAGYAVGIEVSAGLAAYFSDEAYKEAGATVESDAASLVGAADLILKVNAPATGSAGRNEVQWMRPGAVFVASIMPQKNLDAVRALAGRKITAFSTDAIPRTTRAQ